jgi:hypothetical protein
MIVLRVVRLVPPLVVADLVAAAAVVAVVLSVNLGLCVLMVVQPVKSGRFTEMQIVLPPVLIAFLTVIVLPGIPITPVRVAMAKWERCIRILIVIRGAFVIVARINQAVAVKPISGFALSVVVIIRGFVEELIALIRLKMLWWAGIVVARAEAVASLMLVVVVLAPGLLVKV